MTWRDAYGIASTALMSLENNGGEGRRKASEMVANRAYQWRGGVAAWRERRRLWLRVTLLVGQRQSGRQNMVARKKAAM